MEIVSSVFLLLKKRGDTLKSKEKGIQKNIEYAMMSIKSKSIAFSINLNCYFVEVDVK